MSSSLSDISCSLLDGKVARLSLLFPSVTHIQRLLSHKATRSPQYQPEHSLEVQIPFLQRRFSEFEILPVCMGLQDMQTAIEVGEEISSAAKKVNRKVVVIASSDFTHYEPQETARKVDTQLLEAVLNMDVKELYNRVYRYDATACGYGPIAATITASAVLGAKMGKLLCYATSGDVSGDYSQVVGYGAVVFT